MHTEDKANIPKLTHDGSNWVDYCDRVLWLLESQNIDAHINPVKSVVSFGMFALSSVCGIVSLEAGPIT